MAYIAPEYRNYEAWEMDQPLLSGNLNSLDMGSRDVDARRAGEILYRSLSLSAERRRGPVPWDHQACCGIMSPVRRTFCLVVTFDLIFTFILWGIYTQVVTQGMSWDDLIDEVVHYTFHYSLFDTVLCAAWRFAPLQLAYALFRIQNPSVVAITTFGTCAFVLVKVFIFKFDDAHNNVLCYLLLISSFIIAWIEAWFLDFKVLTREARAREREAQMFGDERAPLLRGGQPNQVHDTHDQYYSPHDQSPQGSEEPSPFHSAVPSRSHSRSSSVGSWATSLGSQEQEYVLKAEEAWDQTWDILHTEDGWKKETGSSLETGIVFSRSFPKTGKLFKLEAYVDATQDELFDLLVRKCDSQPNWNPTLLEGRTLQVINENTDIYYSIAAEAAGGLVSSRDFVSLRHWATKDGIIVSGGCAVMHPDMPPTKKHVRGENRPGGWIFKPVPGEPNRCMFCWIINTDLKGWIPQYAVDQALSGTLLEFTKHVQKQMKIVQNGFS